MPRPLHNLANWFIDRLEAALPLVVLACVLVGLVGCVELTPEQQAAVKLSQQNAKVKTVEIKSATDVKLATDKGAADVREQQGNLTPTLHPLAAFNNEIVRLHGLLWWFFVPSLIAWIVLFGFSKSGFVGVASIAAWACPILRWMWVISLAGIFAIPFLSWAFAIVGIAFIALTIFEIVKHRGNVADAAAAQRQFLIDLLTGKATATTQTATTSTTVLKTATGQTVTSPVVSSATITTTAPVVPAVTPASAAAGTQGAPIMVG